MDESMARELGVQSLSVHHLIACLSYLNNASDGSQACFQSSLWRNPARSSILSDLYASLAEGLRNNSELFDKVRSLCIYPVASDSEPQVWSNAESLYSDLWTEIPMAWQTPLVKCLSCELELTQPARQLLKMLGVSQLEEDELNSVALRVLLKSGDSVWFATWCALAILRRSFLLGRPGPRPWQELRDAIVLPASSGEWLPPNRLRLPTFLGVEKVLSQNLSASVWSFLGDSAPDPNCVQSIQRPPLSMRGEDHDVEWEVFLWNLGCMPLDPDGRHADAYIEATLNLGKRLSSGSFWSRVSQLHGFDAYCQAVLFKNGDMQRVLWCQSLPTCCQADSESKFQVSVKDLFVSDVFRPLAGNYVPYMEGAPNQPAVLRYLRELGIATEVNQQSILKLIHWLRVHDIDDVALVAELYGKLGSQFRPEPDEELIFVPGVGFKACRDCSWSACPHELLQKCCQSLPLAPHYQRYGSDVCSVLQSWVRPSPMTNASELCHAMFELVNCAKASAENPRCPSGKSPVYPEEAASALFEVGVEVVRALADLCIDQPLRGNDAMVAKMHFRTHRLICIPQDSSASHLRHRMVSSSEAYWTVGKSLESHPCAAFALKEHYGRERDVEAFFINVLGICPVLCRWEVAGRDVMLGGEAAETNDAVPARLDEGLDFSSMQDARPLVHRPQNLQDQMSAALRKAQQSLFHQHSHYVENGMAAASPSQSPHPQRKLPPRTWEHMGNLGRFPVFCIRGEALPDLQYFGGPPNLALLEHLCGVLGLLPGQVAFAFDPSGRCVCSERIFINYLSINSSYHVGAGMGQQMESQIVFWLIEIAYAIAYQGVGNLASCDDLFQIQSALVVSSLPDAMAFLTQRGHWNQYVGSSLDYTHWG
eukprot:TRINITY_DN8863_c0_g1_i5.p1 TRINITY_DN8863_c0_g1~~TRINITY_DN8863_c0_g1_i5.p1  ORF type:complete len:922 (-),score=84.20 TRINITY_DN8863_c0_g1_i5:28-2661(-)